jgi:hypothetical protein
MLLCKQASNTEQTTGIRGWLAAKSARTAEGDQ